MRVETKLTTTDIKYSCIVIPKKVRKDLFPSPMGKSDEGTFFECLDDHTGEKYRFRYKIAKFKKKNWSEGQCWSGMGDKRIF